MLELGKKVYGEYKISSMPFDSKDDTWEDIRNYWKNCDVTTYFDNIEKKWYIISK